MKLALIFLGTFLGVLFLVGLIAALLKQLDRLMTWVAKATGRSPTQVGILTLIVLVAFVMALEITTLVALGHGE